MSEPLTEYRDKFIRLLNDFDGDGAVDFCLSLLSDCKIDVPTLYQEVLAPSLNRILVPRLEEDGLIWKEHTMTQIVRSVVECARPFVLKKRAQYGGLSKKALLACPEEEYHEIGVRMGADFFRIAGFDVLYIGCNAPAGSILEAAKVYKPDVVGLSVSNCLNLVQLKRLTAGLKQKLGGVILAVSGSAILRAGKTAADFGADAAVNSFGDVISLKEGLL